MKNLKQKTKFQIYGLNLIALNDVIFHEITQKQNVCGRCGNFLKRY